MQRQMILVLRRQWLSVLLLLLLSSCVPAESWLIQPPAASDATGDDMAALVQAPARHPIQIDIFYFVMPDRFANGETGNDAGESDEGADRLVTGFDPTAKGFFHGGDIAGLIDKLDYLEELGVTAIWMTPIFKNKTVQGGAGSESAAYHGYWILDYTQLDPHFGTNDELQMLIEQAHARDIKIFFDIITNHTADVIQYEEGQSGYRSKSEYPYRDATGLAFDDQDYVSTGTFPTLSPTQSFPYTPIVPQEERNSKVPPWLNAPIYYHNRGNSQFSGENSLYGDFFGLDDLFTEHPKVVQGMIDIYTGWISDFDIDGFRIDTVKHVNSDFWRQFSDAILTHAKEVGKEEFFIFGEVFSGNDQLLSYYTTDSDMPGVLDFRMQGSVRDYVSQGNSATNLQAFFEYDDTFIDEDSNAYSLPTFIGNHDMGRFGYFLNNDNGNALSDDELLARTKLANALIFFARGVPIIYYGDEQGFTGDGGDQDARQDMFPSQVASYNDDDLIGTTTTTADDNFDTTHPIYQALAAYAELRQAHPALQIGAQIHRYASEGAGIYAFSRIDRQERIEYIVAVNNSAEATANVQTFYGSGESFTLLYSEGGDAPSTLTTDADGKLSITVPAMGFVIYQAGQPIPASTAAPAITISTLTSNQEVARSYQEIDGNQVPERIEVRAALTDSEIAPQYLEVTFAVRQSGEEEFVPIGVDDNPPYRVFYDASIWPDETQLDFMAIANDLNDHTSSALVEQITPRYQRPAKPDPQASAYRYAVIHYLRSDGDYGDSTTGNANDFWGLHVWGDGLASGEATDWGAPKVFWGEDDYGRFAWVKLLDATKEVGFIVHRGDEKDGTEEDRFFTPLDEAAEIWLKQDDPTIYSSLEEAGGTTTPPECSTDGTVVIHYHRPAGDYGDYESEDPADFWGLHAWNAAQDPGWETPYKPIATNSFGVIFEVEVDQSQEMGYILHRGDEKDPGPDQFLNFEKWDCEIWQVQGAEPEAPYVLPVPEVTLP